MRLATLLHLLAALSLAAGSFSTTAMRYLSEARRRRAGLDGAARGLALDALWVALNGLTLPGLIVAGALGFHLAAGLGYRFAEVWVQTAIALWLVMLLGSIFVLRPRLKRERLAPGAGPILDVASAAFADLNSAGVIILTALMVLKP